LPGEFLAFIDHTGRHERCHLPGRSKGEHMADVMVIVVTGLVMFPHFILSAFLLHMLVDRDSGRQENLTSPYDPMVMLIARGKNIQAARAAEAAQGAHDAELTLHRAA